MTRPSGGLDHGVAARKNGQGRERLQAQVARLGAAAGGEKALFHGLAQPLGEVLQACFVERFLGARVVCGQALGQGGQAPPLVV